MMNQKILIGSIEIDYIILHPEKTKVILMVHGFSGNHRGLLAIAAQLNDYKIIIPDLPGHGKTPPMDDRLHSVEGFAEVIHEFSQQLDLQSFTLLGHSFGALIAAKIAASWPKGIQHLILINPVSESKRWLAALGRTFYAIGLGLPKPLGHAFLKSQTISRIQSLLMTKSRDPETRRRIMKHHLEDLQTFTSEKVIAEAVESVLNQGVLQDALQIHVPTLLIVGEHDDLAPLKSQKKLHQLIKNSVLEIIPDTGHLVHHEKATEAAALIRNYLNSESNRPTN